MTHTKALAIPRLTQDSLALYKREVARFPVLSQEEEHALALRWHDEGDVEAARQLVLSNLRFVIKIAYEYVQYGFPLVDLIQEGNVGLMKAVKKFDPRRGIRLVSYAVFWIRAQIHEYIQRSWSLVRVATTRTQRKLFHMLQSTRSSLRRALAREAQGGEGEAELQAVARDLDVDVQEIREMQRRTAARDLSIHQPLGDGSDEDPVVADTLTSPWEDPEESVVDADLKAQFHEALAAIEPQLTERERVILRERLLSEEPAKLEDLGKRFGVSKERTRQIEAALLKKLRTRLADYGIEAAA